MKGKSLYLCNRFREGEPLEDDRLAELRLRGDSADCCTEYLTLRCARERERVSRTPSENLPKIFQKTFEKFGGYEKRLTFANAFPLKQGMKEKSSLKDFG